MAERTETEVDLQRATEDTPLYVDMAHLNIPRLIVQAGVISLLAAATNLSFADEPDIKACLPWTDRVGITIGMDRKSFEELCPSAQFASIDGYPKDPNAAVTGPYIEGIPGQQNQPFWLYYVTKDILSAVTWAVASRATMDQSIIDELAKIRAKLVEAHGEPAIANGLRLSGGVYTKIRQEIFRPHESKTAIVLTATSSAGGSEIGVRIYPLSEVSRFSYETIVRKIDQTKYKEDLSGDLLTDLLESHKAKTSPASQ